MNKESSEIKKIQVFTDLNVWQEGHALVLLVYRATRNFPREEQFGLTSQMRRAAVSVTSNIAEGFGRRGFKEKLQFYFLAKGSLTELKNQIIIAKDVGYIDEAQFQELYRKADSTDRILQGLIRATKSRISK